jgi:hypothetical protein
MASVSPLLKYAIEQPERLADHASAYLGLAAAELDAEVTILQQRLMWQLVMSQGLSIGLTLAGVALLLWVALPQPLPLGWMALPPLLPLLVSLGIGIRQRRYRRAPAFAVLRAQAATDVRLLSRLAKGRGA